MASNEDDKDKTKPDDKPDEKRDALKTLIKEVFKEVIAEEKDSGRTDKGKETASSRSSMWDSLFGG